ncbi:hypothetical protein [Parabacteroides sp. PF5-6]|uniref:hypothetical protein n=1 Tax=Parabacteroides sp. PF5-6 TaxID=1742403 RepID=UPI0024062C5F|nr:hypothetical protein [Parabacteroides sp. PF5-6]MDF9829899.1 hypothetical protein [Parabacteroides sp. PF5-6]
MTVLELNAKKAELEEAMPCQYTPEEIIAGALQAIEEAENGGGVYYRIWDCRQNPEKLRAEVNKLH